MKEDAAGLANMPREIGFFRCEKGRVKEVSGADGDFKKTMESRRPFVSVGL